MEIIPYLEYSLYEMFHMFIFWSFVGWCIEVCWMTLETGEYQNRGFLNMPICPIYGFGVLMVVIFFRPISHTFFPLFITTGLLCTTFELLVGLGMEKLFGARWWDYSHEKFNYKGYICPKISILWGLGCVLVVRIVHPTVEMIIDHIPVKVGLGLIVIWSVLIVIDLISSICAVNKLNNRLKQIDEISKVMLLSAVKIGENLAEKTLETKEKYDKIIEAKDAKTQEWRERYEHIIAGKDGESRFAEIRQKYGRIVDAADFKVSEWKEKYEKVIGARDRSVERLIKAFPQLRSISYSESMDTLKKKLSELSIRSKKGKNTDENDETDISGQDDE
ncbi:MAG: hypothetical protein J1E40_09815 [Oscillospiraceae bacterium]|nr:hypothetical protein [Oscillospiraceae bacterium]